MAWPADTLVFAWAGLAFVIACGGAYGVVRWADTLRRRSGRKINVLWWNVGLIIGFPLLVWLVLGAPTEMDIPVFKGFNFSGGAALSPQNSQLRFHLNIFTTQKELDWYIYTMTKKN